MAPVSSAHTLHIMRLYRVERSRFLLDLFDLPRADNIMSRFASKLRRLAASDKLISSGGVSRYVQAVLVPELAVLLVKDDMKVDEEKAREVLRESVEIGNLLNEEEDEIIMDPAPKETQVSDETKKDGLMDGLATPWDIFSPSCSYVIDR